MAARRYVVLDPDGMADGTGWLYVVMRAQTGIFYQQQYGPGIHRLVQLRLKLAQLRQSWT
jgi:hypothetical protein